jgi:hypothetical protein
MWEILGLELFALACSIFLSQIDSITQNKYKKQENTAERGAMFSISMAFSHQFYYARGFYLFQTLIAHLSDLF